MPTLRTRRRARAGLAGLLALLCLLTPGCLTTFQAASDDGPAVFGGTRLSVGTLRHVAARPSGLAYSLLLLFWFLDLPLSLAADAALLPVSIVNEAAQGGIDPAFPDFGLGGLGTHTG